MFAILTKFVEENDCKPAESNPNDFDEILFEVSPAAEQCNGDYLEDMMKMVDGGVSMEDNEFCQTLLANEVDELIDIDALCKSKESTEDDKNKE